MEFKQMKTLIAELPMLTAPKEKEELVIYLAATKEAVSAVLMTEKDEKQIPIYFVSRTLQGPEINYTLMEKLILALGENKKAYALSKIASTSFAHLSKQVLVEEIKEKSIDENEVLAVVEEEGRTWMTPINEYLVEEILPEEKKKSRDVHRKARRSVVAKALRSGYYWPTMYADASKLIRDCNDCQFRDNPFKDWCEKLCIRQCFAFVKHPQANGLVERANKSLGEGIKARLDERCKN
nr:hypothetical protein [Tanacetum cinerariifolium]